MVGNEEFVLVQRAFCRNEVMVNTEGIMTFLLRMRDRRPSHLLRPLAINLWNTWDLKIP